MSQLEEHSDLAGEREFYRRALEALAEMRTAGRLVPSAGGDKKASAALDRLRAEREARLRDESSVCFGRTDTTAGKTNYIGKQVLWDPEHTTVPLVISWQSPAAEPFFSATPDDPAGLQMRRRFRIAADTIVGIADEVFAGTGSATEPAMDDILLAELGRERTVDMQDIVATIQRDQYRIISRELATTTFVQGGPGTGKTAVGLHRAAWLLFRHRDDLGTAGVLVVGPNRLFMDYISYVLPSLGETSATQVAIDAFVEDIVPSVDDAELVARVKGDGRMAPVLVAAIKDRVRPPGDAIDFATDRLRFKVSASAVADLVEDFDPTAQSYSVGREQFRQRFATLVRESHDRAFRTLTRGSEIAPIVDARSLPEFDRALDRIWPSISATELVRQLLSSEERLDRAASAHFDDLERRMLYRKPVDRIADVRWTTSDVPLVDYGRHLIDGRTRSYGHVVIDEAQDLTPMQLAMVGRRIRSGSVTVLGDLAQATGTFDYSSWDEVAESLGFSDPAQAIELRRAYRVPREIMDVAAPVLELTAPSVRRPESYRDGGRDVDWVHVESPSISREALVLALQALEGSGTVAIIAPARHLDALRGAFRAEDLSFGDLKSGQAADTIAILDPKTAKGLEFDHVILVEPAAIVRHSARSSMQGHRELYVALTRAMRSLTVVHSEPLPWPLSSCVEPVAIDAAERAPARPVAVENPPTLRETENEGESAPTERDERFSTVIAQTEEEPDALIETGASETSAEAIGGAVRAEVVSENGRSDVSYEAPSIAISIPEAMAVAHLRGIPLQHALARALLALTSGATEFEASSALLNASVDSETVDALLAIARDCAEDPN